MTTYTIRIEPKPQSRPRFGNGRTYEKSDMTCWKRNVALSLRAHKPKAIETGAIAFLTTFYIYPPKRIREVKKHQLPLANERLFVHKRPDVDNYLKALLDASNGILFKDDGQIAVVTAQKLYSLNPRIEIEIYKLEE